MQDETWTEIAAMHAAVVSTSLDAIIVADSTGRVVAFNPAAEAMFGHSRDEAIGRTIGELIVPDHHRAAHEAGMTRYMSGAPARVLGRRLELEARHRSGTVFPVELAITEAVAEGSHFFVASLRDLSERRKSESFLRALVDDQSELVIRSDADFRIIFCNTAAARFFGMRREDLIGHRFTPGTPPDVQARLEAELPFLTPDAPLRESVDPKILPSGETRWLRWSNRALFDAAGRLEGHLSVARDITDERAAAAELERSSRENALYRRMFEAMPDSIYAKDRQGRFIAANAALARALGRADTAGLIGLSDADLHPPHVARRYAESEAAFYTSGEESRLITQPIWQPDGSESWQMTRKTLFRDENGSVIGLIGHGRDVTDQVLAERALAQSEARFAAFAENAPIAMFLKDEAGRYVMLNEDACTVIGLPRDQILGRTAREVGTPGSADQTEAADRTVRATGLPLQTEGPLVRDGTRYRQALILRFPVPSPDGKSMWIGGFAIDTTPQKEAEAALERSRDALRQSEKMTAMGSLLAGVAHELNNPLAIVVAQASLLADDTADTPVGIRADKIRRAAERCGRIVQTFLGLARAKPSERRACDLGEMVHAATELMSYPLRTAGIELRLDLASDLPRVDGDPDLLAQVVLNLLINAQQALERSDAPRIITLATRLTGGEVTLDISDNGPGVDPMIRDRIFDPFFSTKPQGVGTGVGLSFCQNVISAHSGTLTLRDTPPGTGATFRIALPPARTVATVSVPEPEVDVPARLRALVIDDEGELAEALAEMLAAAGFEADVVVSAVEAQGLAREGRYDVVLSDLRMPGMDGPAFHAWLREVRPDLADRTVFVTGDALGVVAARFLSESGRPVIEKPFTRVEVLKAVALATRPPSI